MKFKIRFLSAITFIILISCGSSNNDQPGEPPIANNTTVTAGENQQESGIIGEWEQQYTCFDKNGNYKLEANEKIASGTKLGFDWFRFNADGSCLRDKDVQLKGTYSIQEKNGTKKLIIEGGDNLRYSITELFEQELILGSEGAFIIFKRIK